MLCEVEDEQTGEHPDACERDHARQRTSGDRIRARNRSTWVGTLYRPDPGRKHNYEQSNGVPYWLRVPRVGCKVFNAPVDGLNCGK